MKTYKQICDGDSLIQAKPNDGSTGPQDKVAPTVAHRKSEAMRGFFPQLAVWLTNHIHFSRMREIENYLAQATDLADLEHRIAKIERGALSH